MAKNTCKYKVDESEIMSSRIVIEARCYPMTEYKFDKLISNSTGVTSWAKDIFLIGLGLSLKVLCVWGQIIYKGYSDVSEISILVSKIESWEYLVILITFVISFSIWVTSKCTTSGKDKLIRDIKTFFNEGKNMNKHE